MKHTITHDVSDDLARKAAEKAFDSYKSKFAEYHPSVAWKKPDAAEISFKVKGVKLDGSVALRPNAIDLELDVPFVFRLFQKRAIDVIEGEVREWLDRAKRGEL